MGREGSGPESAFVASAAGGLDERQRALLLAWLPGAHVVRDLGWGLVPTTVLEVKQGGQRYVVKAGGATDSHIGRELTAHRLWLAPWTAIGRAPVLVQGDLAARILVTRYLPGELVLGHPSEADPATYRQAGALLALLHTQESTVHPDYEQRRNVSALAWLDGPHAIPADLVDEVRARMAHWPSPASVVVPTHGDWQPRNWVVDQGVVGAIDFGRAELRPAFTDLMRLAYRDFRGDPALEVAFFEGYGPDPREDDPGAWERELVREGVSTAGWAHRVGDDAFASEGVRLLRRALGAG